MDTMGFTAAEKDETFRLIAAILWLGNIAFQDDAKDQSQVIDENVLNMVAFLMQTDANSLRAAITTR